MDDHGDKGQNQSQGIIFKDKTVQQNGKKRKYDHNHRNVSVSETKNGQNDIGKPSDQDCRAENGSRFRDIAGKIIKQIKKMYPVYGQIKIKKDDDSGQRP